MNKGIAPTIQTIEFNEVEATPKEQPPPLPAGGGLEPDKLIPTVKELL